MDEKQPKITLAPLSVVTEADSEHQEAGLARITLSKDGIVELFVSGLYTFDTEALVYALEKVKLSVLIAACITEDE